MSQRGARRGHYKGLRVGPVRVGSLRNVLLSGIVLVFMVGVFFSLYHAGHHEGHHELHGGAKLTGVTVHTHDEDRPKLKEQPKPSTHEVTPKLEVATETHEEEDVTIETEVTAQEGDGDIEHNEEEAVPADGAARSRSRGHSRSRSRPASTGDQTLIVPRGKKEVINISEPLDYKDIMSDIDIPTGDGWAGARIKMLVVNHEDVLLDPATAEKDFNKHLVDQMMNTPGCIPETDLKERYRTCAVVGNGGALLHDPRTGAAIDAHDAVLRFNDGPTQGFEQYVGTKTTFRLINNAWTRYCTEHRNNLSPKYTNGALILFGRGAKRHFVDLCQSHKVYFMDNKLSGAARGVYRKVFAKLETLGAVAVSGRNTAPTGMEGIMFALSMCHTVRVYGFNVDQPPEVPYHYHDNVRGVESAHSFNYQGLFLKILDGADALTICSPADVAATPKGCV
eukprot:CAMPEP_0118928146 /NCGR_PEP_ID=MMETSP1169-20130426/5470_1 /TAXON_ID=36882 /ORGANISM="Pyramimonas obovata, Strain CCMP722" /LENGTH=449 /DNA_ID=CAMNT_0006870061 /DNA_START=103 /DNA_END=1452 /DNA_ORIENTATION=-